ncbi:MAG: lamin tail domain-containing protein [Deltaproteobacteria bacterium]|nr:lamin tail domain-containing protein [Deltaproteobacteria bacterium]
MYARSPQILLTLSSALLLAACALGSTLDEDDGSGGQPSSSGAGGDTGTSSTSTSSGTTSSSTSGTTSTSSTSSTSGTGGDNAGGAGGGSSSSSSSSGTNNCAHDICTPGVKLTMGCGDPCVDTVCLQDAYCCDSEWDQLCVDEAGQFCGANCGGGGGGGGGAPLPGDLVISEIMNNPAVVSDSVGEWFEIYNDTNLPIDLTGLVIRHHATDPQSVHTIAQSVVVAPGGYAVLGNNANASTNGNVTVDYQYPYAVNLGNTADYLAIETGNAQVIDETSWDQASGLDPNGKSRNLNPQYLTAYENDTDLNFCEATSVISGGSDLGSPGISNDNCQ